MRIKDVQEWDLRRSRSLCLEGKREMEVPTLDFLDIINE